MYATVAQATAKDIRDLVQWVEKVWVGVSVGRIKNQVKKYITTLSELSERD